MEKEVQQWFVDISTWNPPDDRFFFFISLLPDHERAPITRFIKFEDRKRALVSRLLQYSLVHEILGINFTDIIINRTSEGKPYLENGQHRFPNFNFNVSHHGKFVGIAFHPVCLVGLDIISIIIPQQETVLDFIRNFTSYFTNFEWESIMNSSNSDVILADFCRILPVGNITYLADDGPIVSLMVRDQIFSFHLLTFGVWYNHRYWSLKEAFVKALGTGLGYGLHRLEFRHDNWSNISVYVDGVKSADWRFWIFELDKSHWATIAKGPPNVAAGSYQRAFAPDNAFTFCTVEELIHRIVNETASSNTV